MKKFFFLLALLSFIVTTAQQSLFYLTVAPPSGTDVSGLTVLNNGTNFVQNNEQYATKLVCFDDAGLPVFTKIYLTDDYVYFGQVFATRSNETVNVLYMGQQNPVSPEATIRYVILKLDSSGNTIFVKNLINVDTTSLNRFACITSDSMGNTFVAHVSKNYLNLLKLDQSGTVSYAKSLSFSSGHDYYIHNILATQDGGILMYASDFSEQLGKMLFKFDAAGNQVWVKTFSFLSQTVSLKEDQIALTPQGEIIISTYYSLLKLDQNGNFIAASTHNLPDRIIDLKVLPSGEILAICGGFGMNPALISINADLQSINYAAEYVNKYTGLPDINSLNTSGNNVCLSGRMLMTFLSPTSPSWTYYKFKASNLQDLCYHFQFNALVSADSASVQALSPFSVSQQFTVTNLSVDIRDTIFDLVKSDFCSLITSAPQLTSDSYDVQIFPNPANNNVNIGISPDMSGSPLKIMDMTGRIVLETQLLTSNSTINIHLLSSGVYMVTFSLPDKRTVSRKLVVEK